VKRICIVTNEIFGPHKNGGIGTSQTFLAMLLAANSYSVDILYTGEIDHRDRQFWVNWYAVHGINFIELMPSRRSVFPLVFQKSHEIYDYLKGCSHEALIFQDWMGDGYATTCAKRIGEFQNTTIVTWLHSPSLWLRYANRQWVTSTDDLYQIEMERVAVEQSDIVLSPSQYLLDWVHQNGWTLKNGGRHMPLYIPNVFLDEDGLKPFAQLLPGTSGRAATRKLRHKGHVVFFGRLEFRKGVEEFAAALRELASDRRIRRITFLGKSASHSLDNVRALMGPRVEGCKIEHIDDYDTGKAMQWLLKQDPLIVIPSLVDNSPCVIYECLNNNLNFVTTDSGGMPELISREDWATHVCPPRGREIAQVIRANLNASGAASRPPRPALSVEENAKNLLAFFDGVASRKEKGTRERPKNAENVTVVMTHFERPHMLDGALGALENQTLKGFKVVLVDDHSTSAAAQSKLSSVERRKYSFDLRVVRKESNDYLGAARNAGIANVDTEYVIFLDDDNLAMPGMVEKFLSAISFSGADIVTSMMVGFENLGALRHDEIDRYQHWAFIPKSLALAPVANAFGDATSIYRCACVREVGGYHESYGVTHEDWELHLKAAVRKKRHEYMPSVTFWYRGSPDSMSRTTSKYLNDRCQIEAWSALLPDSAKAIAGFIVGIERRSKELVAENAALRARIVEIQTRYDREEMSARAHLKRISQVLQKRSVVDKMPGALVRIIQNSRL
jgi:O-antigen biosynthesis protein